MAFHRLPGCGLLFERSPLNRLAIARINRQIGPRMRGRTEKDDYLIALSFAMSYQDVLWACVLAEKSGSKQGVNFVPFTGDQVIGPSPAWLVVADEPPADPLLGLRQETWDNMEPSVREYWDALRLKTSRTIRHAVEVPALSTATRA